ncbi:MAG: NADH-quinone oxidoreductase subunit N [Deltaproteobacteria bacterium]|nr:NADH-quinone oxidoreductase subunit N [Deltaproteobacteria bacterium]
MTTVLALSPLLVVAIGGCLMMLADVFAKDRSELAFTTAVTLGIGAILAAALAVMGPPEGQIDSLGGHLALDRLTYFVTAVTGLGGALSALLAGGHLQEHGIERGEFYPLLLFATLGAMILAAATDLLTLFIGLETMSLGAYCMTAFRRSSPRSAEGGVKYFLLSSFAAAILLYGGALLYGVTGHTGLVAIAQSLGSGKAGDPLAVVALALLVIGLAFKVGAVPFHMWAPDAYEGAPTPATAFMASVVKAAAFAAMIRVLLRAFGDSTSSSALAGWPPIVAGLTLATLIVANLAAVRQSSVKRMLAYSSLAHAGYVMIGLLAAWRTGEHGRASMLFYLLAYAASTAGAFGGLILCGSKGKEAVSYEDLAGIGRRHPAVALPFAFFLLSLAGIPPTAGFFAKYYVFSAAVEAGGGMVILAIVGALSSAVGLFYYLRVLVFMYMREPAAGAAVAVPMKSGYVVAALGIAAVLVLLIGAFPGPVLEVALSAAK